MSDRLAVAIQDALEKFEAKIRAYDETKNNVIGYVRTLEDEQKLAGILSQLDADLQGLFVR